LCCKEIFEFFEFLMKTLTNLISQDFAKNGNLRLLGTVFLNPADNTHGPLDSKGLKAIFLVQIRVHKLLHGFHRDTTLLTDLILLSFAKVNVVDGLLELVECDGFGRFAEIELFCFADVIHS
jgi:hypothetical protein